MRKAYRYGVIQGLVLAAVALAVIGCSSVVEEQVSGAPSPSGDAVPTTVLSGAAALESSLKGVPGEPQSIDGKEFFVLVSDRPFSFVQRDSAEFHPLVDTASQYLSASDVVSNYRLQAPKVIAPLELSLGTISDSVLSAPGDDGEVALVLQERPVWLLVEAGIYVADSSVESSDPPVESTAVRVIDALTGMPILEFTDPTNRVVA